MKKKIISFVIASGLVFSMGIGGCAYKCTHDFVYNKMHIIVNNDAINKTR